jgi:hypothetical protein
VIYGPQEYGGLDLIWAAAPQRERERVKLCIGFAGNHFVSAEGSIIEKVMP